MIMRFTDPFQALLGLQSDLDRAYRSDWFGSSTTSAGSFPPINVFRQGEDYVVVAELPGVERGELDIQIKDNYIRISGNKPVTREEKHSVHRRERVSGKFDRTLRIPVQVDPSHVKAELRDGVLAVHLPRAESDKPRSVPIN